MASNSKKKQTRLKEQQDAQGISRKKWRFKMSPNLFFSIKLVLILLIPFVYFIYSPLLVLVLISYVGLFFLARAAEHSMNKSVIKANHIHIAKFDSAIALIIIVIAFAGACMNGASTRKKAMFENFSPTQTSSTQSDLVIINATEQKNINFAGARKNMALSKVKTWFINFGCCLTGERSVFENSKKFNFGSKEPPKDFVSDPSEVRKGDLKEFSMDNIPVEYVFSSSLSTVNTILIFSVSGFGVFSLIMIYLKKRKFDREMNEVIYDEKIEILNNDELDKILSFGEDAEILKISQDEIECKIKETEEKDKKELENYEIVQEILKKEQNIDERIEILEENNKNDQ